LNILAKFECGLMFRLKVRRFSSLPDLTVLLIEISIGIYTHNPSVSVLFTNENGPSEKLSSVISGLLVINLLRDLQTDEACQKQLSASFHRYLPREIFHITNRIPYTILYVFLFVHWYICW
jgi:hypothetical protein